MPITIEPVDIDGPLFTIPAGETFTVVQPIDVANYTTGHAGTGAFDKVMTSLRAHLKNEFDGGRITGAEYTKAYIALTTAAMSTALQLLLNKDSAYWNAVKAQTDAITARVQLETQRVAYATAVKTLEEALPAQIALAQKQVEVATAQITLTGAQANLAGAQMLHTQAQKNLVDGQLAQLPHQTDLIDAQVTVANQQQALISEQQQAARAQTLDTRSDSFPVTGVLGAQKSLYAQQVLSYQRDADVKMARLFTDAWITQKTVDEGLEPPANFTNEELDEILSQVRARNTFT